MCFKPSRSICCIYCIITIFLVMVILFIAFLSYIISPSNVKFHITDATLAEFNLTSNNTLYYKFNVNITFRNPNNNVIVYYRRIDAVCWYKDKDFGYVGLTPFVQGHKNTTFVGPIVFEGKSVIKLRRKQLDEYNDETRVGIYNDLAVDLDFLAKFKLGWYKSSRFSPPIVQCRRLRVSLISNATKTADSELPFKDRKCTNSYFFVDRDEDD